jgi:hypothetical protein
MNRLAGVGLALKKNEPALKERDSGSSGEASKIFDAWSGPVSEMPVTVTFRIQPD